MSLHVHMKKGQLMRTVVRNTVNPPYKRMGAREKTYVLTSRPPMVSLS